MACGLGLCHTCVVPVTAAHGGGARYLRACVEGPIFDPASIVWERWVPQRTSVEPTSHGGGTIR